MTRSDFIKKSLLAGAGVVTVPGLSWALAEAAPQPGGKPKASFTVTLQFNEPAYSEAGKRVFGVKLQGRQVVTGLDIFARVGANHALDLSYPDIHISDGKLHVEFTREVEFPCIAGIVIQGTTQAANQLAGVPFVRRIDCGGPASDGYEADAVGGQGLPPAGKKRAMPIQDFYQDYARANFGEAAAEALGDWFEQRDGPGLPEVSGWNVGPGVITASSKPWSEERNRFAFVDELAALRIRVKGAGNLERFDYWLNTYRAMATMAELSCLRGQLDRSMKERDYDRALAARIELAAAWSRLLSLQTAIVRTPGELGTIANLEQQTRARSGLVNAHDEALVKALGHALPPEAAFSTKYAGEARLILPTVRSLAVKGEPLRLRILALDRQPVERVVVHIRSLGNEAWRETSAAHLGRAVFRAELPAAEEDFEYWVSTVNGDGLSLVWPATAPEINQTVVVVPGS